jgi:hypothetical protein
LTTEINPPPAGDHPAGGNFAHSSEGRNMNRHIGIFLLSQVVTMTCAPASAVVIVYKSSFDVAAKSLWQAAAGSYSTMDFTGFPDNTFLLDQYAYLGVHFTDGSDGVKLSDVFIIDGAGVYGSFDETTLEFDVPMTSIALDFPGTCAIKLFYKGSQIYQSPLLAGVGLGVFAGLISTEPFDSAQLYDPFSGFNADNIYFNSATSFDCNQNGQPDTEDMANGVLVDLNGNGFPDECESCIKKGDINCNNKVDVDDLLYLINSWGQCEKGLACPADVYPTNGDGMVNGQDLMEVINHWS